VAARLGWEEIGARFGRAAVWWLVTADRSAGPHAVPVWGVVVDGVLYCYADPASRRMRDLREDRRAVAHLEDGSDVLIVHGDLHDLGAAADHLRSVRCVPSQVPRSR